MARRSFQAIGEVGYEELEPTARELFELGLKYCIGAEIELDLVEAHKWFNIAALRGVGEARSYRSEISQEMSRNEISQAQRAAREWLRRHESVRARVH